MLLHDGLLTGFDIRFNAEGMDSRQTSLERDTHFLLVALYLRPYQRSQSQDRGTPLF
jgi:hypothetical protein